MLIASERQPMPGKHCTLFQASTAGRCMRSASDAIPGSSSADLSCLAACCLRMCSYIRVGSPRHPCIMCKSMSYVYTYIDDTHGCSNGAMCTHLRALAGAVVAAALLRALLQGEFSEAPDCQGAGPRLQTANVGGVAAVHTQRYVLKHLRCIFCQA